jgi:hypothetical protein
MANKVAPESFDFAEGSAPGTPDSGYVRVYAKADGAMYQKDDAGTETAFGNSTTVVSANKVHKFATNQSTSSNTMVDVDATNAAITATLTGSGKCRVTFNFGAFKSTGGAAFYRITDGTNSSSEVQVDFSSGFIAELTLTHVFDTSAGSTTYKLQFRSNDANAALIHFRSSVGMSLMEIA